MRKIYQILCIAFAILATLPAKGQMYSYTGGTAGNAFPLRTAASNRCQFLYQPSHFVSAPSGSINKIYIMSNDAITAAGAFSNLTIQMGHTALSALTSGTFVGGLTTVYSATSTSYPTIVAAGWYEVTLQTPFPYTSTSNLIVDISQTSYTGSGLQIRYNSSVAGSRLYGSVTGTTGTAGGGLMNMGFDIMTSPCTSPPTAGAATASSATVCLGNRVNLSLTGHSQGLGQTYQWQSATALAGPYTNIGTASPSFAVTATPTGTTYYRAAVTCGASTVNSTPVMVSTSNPINGTFTINSAVATGGANFQTYADAVAIMDCGINGPVTFNVVAGSGPYNEQVTIGQVAGASATNRIRFNGRGTLIRATPVTGARAIVTLNGADYVTFDSVSVSSLATGFGWGFHLTNGADSNTISNCNIDMSAVTSVTAAASAGIVGSGSATSITTAGDASFNTITGNTITGAYQGIIILGGTGAINAVKNIITNNVIKDFYAVGIELSNADSAVIAFNDISRANRAAVTTFTGIEIGTGSKKVIINANKVHDTHNTATTQSGAAYGIFVNSADAPTGSENLVTNNAIYNFNSTTGIQYGLYNSGADGSFFYHNTVALTHATSTSGVARGFYQTTAATNIAIQNNIFYVTRGGSGAAHGVYFNTATSGIACNNNDYFINSPAGTNYIGYANSTNYNWMATWRTAASGIYDQQSDTLNPVFTNLASGNLLPTSTALDNRGVPLGILTDINNASRSNTLPDMGAYEFGLPACLPPTSLAISGNTGTSATVSWNAVTGSAGYEWTVDQSATPPAVNGTPTTATSVPANPLLPLTAYYAHVRNNCGASKSPWVTIPFNTPCISPGASIRRVGSATFCQGDSALLIANGGNRYTYQWKNGTTDITGATKDSLYVLTTGTYSVVVKSDTCSSTATAVPITVNPMADTTVTMTPSNGNICVGTTVLLTAVNVPGNTYQWYRNGVAVAGATSRNYSTSTNGRYTVLIRTSNGCADSATGRIVTQLATPVSTITASATSICAGNSVLLRGSAPATGITYQWLNNGAEIIGATGDTYTAALAGTYRLVLSNGTCADTSTAISLVVNPLPTAIATAAGATSFCTGGSVVLNANAGTGLTYRWLRNGIAILPAATGQSYTATTTGNYTVIVTNTATGCFDTSKPAITATLFQAPATTLTNTTSLTFCEGGSVNLAAQNITGATYVWYRNTSIIAGATTPIYNATTAGTYYAVITNGPCVSTTVSRVVMVNPLPAATATASGATSFCAGGTVILNAGTGAGLTYQWRENTINIPGATAPAYTASASGTYSVVVSNGNCSNTSGDVVVTVSTMPSAVVTAIGSPIFCQGNSITLQATTGTGYTYQWLLNTNPVAGATSSILNATATGNYTVNITNGTCVATSAPFTVSVTPAPPAVITAAGPTSFCQGERVVLNANRGTGYTYQWTMNTVAIPGATNPTFTATSTGDYSVDIFDGNCPATAAPVTVTQNSFPVAAITVSNGVDMSTGTFASYQWFRNGVLIPGATAQNYTAVRDGFYTVLVTDFTNCSATSPVVLISALSIGQPAGKVSVQVYPNPVENTLYVKSSRPVHISIHAIDGKQLLQSENARSIDLSVLSQGLYMVHIIDAQTGTLIKTDRVTKK